MKYFLHPKLLLALSILSGSFLFSTPVFSQVARLWVRLYDDQVNSHNSATAMVTDAAGNIYVTGSGFQLNGTKGCIGDFVTIKYNKFGTLQWVARYDLNSASDFAVALAVSKSGNLYVTGYSDGDGATADIVTIKYNSAGIQQWVNRFNGPGDDYDRASAIQVDNDDNAYVVGYSVTVKGSNPDFVTIKYNSSGVQQWARYHNGTSNGADLAFAMVVDTATSDIYITGSTAFDYSGESGEDYTTVKYNSAGEVQWVRDYKGPGHTNDEARVIAIDGQGNVYVSGYTIGSNSETCATVKYDPSGNMKWVAYYTGPSKVMAQPGAIIADRFGNVYVTGLAADVINGGCCFTIKYNSAGVQQWVQLYNSSLIRGHEEGKALALDADGNVYVGAVSENSNADNDVVAIKYSKEGVQQWAERYDAFNNTDDIAAIAVNKFNDVFVAGSARKNIGVSFSNSYYLTIKYVQPEPMIVIATADTTIYYGSGAACLSLKANITGGVPPYNFTWTPAGITPNDVSIMVCPATTTVYKVIVKDAVGTTDSAQVTVKVDTRCGDKVLVCHNGKELCIAPQAVAAHLQHGDKLGSCSWNLSDCEKLRVINSLKDGLPFIFKAYPNPFSGISTIVYQLPIDALVSITIADAYGREIKTLVREKKRAGYYFVFVDAQTLAAGTYLCKLVISSPPCQSVQTLKLIVVK